ncbi:MAG: magnesium/cobalt transporter CorA [Ginsengibacter sp.]
MKRNKQGQQMDLNRSRKSRRMLRVNPTITPNRSSDQKIIISIYTYNVQEVQIVNLSRVEDCFKYLNITDAISWINIDGLDKENINTISKHFGIHPLFAEDILSIGQRPKMDELNNLLFALLNMLYYNEAEQSVESEQLSIVLGKNFVLSFQQDVTRDLFDPIREKLKQAGSKLRISNSDYLFYSMLDMIVDHYFIIMEKLGERIEDLEEDITHTPDTQTLGKINAMRKEMMFLRRSVSPVREVINGILRSESELIEDRTEKYFKDVYDHIVQANELAENYRDMMINLQDLYLSNVNLKMNEVMKVMAVVTCLLAPATVIGGIFGMNFGKIPFTDNPVGFYLAVGFMLIVPIIMIWIFRKRGWF